MSVSHHGIVSIGTKRKSNKSSKTATDNNNIATKKRKKKMPKKRADVVKAAPGEFIIGNVSAVVSLKYLIGWMYVESHMIICALDLKLYGGPPFDEFTDNDREMWADAHVPNDETEPLWSRWHIDDQSRQAIRLLQRYVQDVVCMGSDRLVRVNSLLETIRGSANENVRECANVVACLVDLFHCAYEVPEHVPTSTVQTLLGLYVRPEYEDRTRRLSDALVRLPTQTYSGGPCIAIKSLCSCVSVVADMKFVSLLLIVQSIAAAVKTWATVKMDVHGLRDRMVQLHPEMDECITMGRRDRCLIIDMEAYDGTTIMLYPKGIIQAKGGKSIEKSREAIDYIVDLLRRGFPDDHFVVDKPFRISSIMASSVLGRQTNINRYAAINHRVAVFEPEVFPGLVRRIAIPQNYKSVVSGADPLIIVSVFTHVQTPVRHVSVNVFSSGEFWITGAQDEDQIRYAIKYITQDIAT